MAPFLFLIVVSIAALLWVFYFSNGASEIRYSSPALAWIWYNLVVLAVLCFVCVERPRKRTAERFASRELVSLKMSDRTLLMQLADFSITGARIFVRHRVRLAKLLSWSCRTFAFRRKSSVSSQARSRSSSITL
jgi:hypothetical protein